MSETTEGGDIARRVFSGLTPSATPSSHGPASAEADIPFRSTRLGRGVMATMPVMLAGAMTVSMNLTVPLDSAAAATKPRPEKAKSQLGASLRQTAVKTAATPTSHVTSPGTITAAAVPTSHAVTAGDTVSSIAGRYGLSTASVLAINGLSWKSLIFPGQVLQLRAPVGKSSAPAPSAAVTSTTTYTIQKGDTITRIAARFGVTVQAVLTANRLSQASIIYGGQTITIPAGASAPLAIQTVAAITPTPASSGTSYTIRSGDTISSISQTTGVAVSAILAANGLTLSSVIYAGRTLAIPSGGVSSAANVTTVSATAAVALAPGARLTDEMAANARVIIGVGQRLGVPDRGIVVALAAAAQESGLRNLTYGDRDSVGLFQQRPSAGWGSKSQLLTTDYAAQLFYGGPSNPNKGMTRGLLDIPGWQSMSVTQAAQAVQISAFPTAYAKWEPSASSWLAQLR